MIESSVSVSASAADGRPVRLLPSLDGLRAVSILLVILGHGVGTGKSQLDLHSPVLEKLFFSHSAIGVRTFFIISGFLITTLLLREKSNFGYISLPAFYTRRCLRILPAFFFYLLVIVVLDRTGFVQLPAGNLLYAVTYTMNFNPNPYWYTGHFWSLSVEEQFYLLWPLALTFLQR
jgi:peptidoglycan/LPS O-acetylase OafA/YrhL